MVEAKILSELLGDLYDAALDPAQWPAALNTLSGFVGGQSAGIAYIARPSKAVDAHHTVGCDPHFLQLYLSRYGQFDPTLSLLLLPTAQVASTGDIMPYDEYCDGRFYREWARPQGWVDSVGATVDKSGSGVVVLSILRNQASGLVDEDTRLRMELVLPHVRRAALIGNVFQRQKAEADSLSDTFDGLSAGLFLVDADGRVVHANESGQAMLAGDSPLRAVAGRLTVVDANVERPLHKLFARAESGDVALGARGTAIPLVARDGRRFVAHVLPLASRARRRAGQAYGAVAAVFVRAATLDVPAAPELISGAYNLTPTELRVLLGIVEIGGVPEVADALGIAETTVKTHLRRIYEKTGARRQADLVKLVAAFSTPLSN
jgi:DNA-binding CsgD family transcriptional regulator/PAS domain-containing protein